jgi:hypothetical protein
MQIKLGLLIGAVLADNFATSIVKAMDALNYINEEGSSIFFPLGLNVVVTDDEGTIDYSSVMILFTTENQKLEVLNNFANEVKSFSEGLTVKDVEEIQQLQKSLGFIKNIEHAEDEDPDVIELSVNVYNELVTEFPAVGLNRIAVGEDTNASKNEGALTSGEGGVVFDKRMIRRNENSDFFDDKELDALTSPNVTIIQANEIVNKFLLFQGIMSDSVEISKRTDNNAEDSDSNDSDSNGSAGANNDDSDSVISNDSMVTLLEGKPRKRLFRLPPLATNNPFRTSVSSLDRTVVTSNRGPGKAGVTSESSTESNLNSNSDSKSDRYSLRRYVSGNQMVDEGVAEYRRSGKLNRLSAAITRVARKGKLSDSKIKTGMNFAMLNSDSQLQTYAPRDNNGNLYTDNFIMKFQLLDMIFNPEFQNMEGVYNLITEALTELKDDSDSFYSNIIAINTALIFSDYEDTAIQPEMLKELNGGVYKYFKKKFEESLAKDGEFEATAYGKILTQLTLISDIDDSYKDGINGIDEYDNKAKLLSKYANNKRMLNIIKAYKTPIDLISEETHLLVQYAKNEGKTLLFQDGDDLMDFISNNDNQLKSLGAEKLGAFYNTVIRQLQHCKSGESMPKSVQEAIEYIEKNVDADKLSPEAKIAKTKIKRFTMTNTNKLSLRKFTIRNSIGS